MKNYIEILTEALIANEEVRLESTGNVIFVGPVLTITAKSFSIYDLEDAEEVHFHYEDIEKLFIIKEESHMTEEQFGNDTFTLIDGGYVIYTPEQFEAFRKMVKEAEKDSEEKSIFAIKRLPNGNIRLSGSL